MVRILVTGVGGFVGRRLARHLVDLGHDVGGTCLGETLEGLEEVTAFHADILDRSAVEKAVRAYEPDAVVHLAGRAHVGASWKEMADYFRVNVLGTENILHAAPHQRVVLASSAEVYGAVPEEQQPIREERELRPQTPYALTKAAAERLALLRNAIVVRSFNVVGPGQSERFALPAFASQLRSIERRQQEAVLKVGNLSPRRDFVHVDDAASAYGIVVERGEEAGIYNLARGRAVSIREALERLLALSGVSARIETDPARCRPADTPVVTGDATRLRELGWRPTRSLDDALADLWRSLEQ